MTGPGARPVEVIEIDGPTRVPVLHLGATEVIELGATARVEVVEVGGRSGAWGPTRLGDLRDVEAPPSDTGVLTRSEPGGYARFVRVPDPPPPPELSYRHTQILESDTWLISHGLTFTPAAVAVVGEAGQQLHPRRIAHPALGRTRLEFTRPVIGTADLS